MNAYVLGNGTSRQAVNLESLRKHGKIYGCNALYRDFSPDVLIATDPGISGEIQHSGYALKHEFYTRNPLPKLGAKRIEYNFGYSSGPIALTYASNSEANKIYILGFDFAGIAGKFNNVYAGTAHYKRQNDPETYFGNWVDQVTTIISAHPNKTYVRIIQQGTLIPKSFAQLVNLEHQPLELFCDHHK